VAGQISDGLKRLPWTTIGGVLLVAAALIVAAYVVKTSGEHALTQREQVLFQVIMLGAGLFGTFVVGRESAKSAARDVIRPSARSAFRRVWALYKGLARLRGSVAERKDFLDSVANLDDGSVAMSHVNSQLSVLLAQIVEQVNTADDAMKDWRDLVPDEVDALEREAAERANEREAAERLQQAQE